MKQNKNNFPTNTYRKRLNPDKNAIFYNFDCKSLYFCVVMAIILALDGKVFSMDFVVALVLAGFFEYFSFKDREWTVY